MLRIIKLKLVEYFAFGAWLFLLLFAYEDQSRAALWEAFMVFVAALVSTYVWLEAIARQINDDSRRTR